jgi:PAS domain S-box-containing protein
MPSARQGAVMNIFDARQATRAPRVLQVLQDSYRVSNAVWDELPVAMYICDADGRLVQFNRRACDIWGYKPDLSADSLRYGAARKLFRIDGTPVTPETSFMREVLETGKSKRDLNLIMERPDGTRVTIHGNLDPVIDDDGKIVGAVNCFQDVTTLKQPAFNLGEGLKDGRDNLFETAQRLDAICDHARIGIAEADENGKIVRVNDAMCAITGFERDDLVGNTMYYRTHPDDVARDRLNYRQQVTGGYDRYAIEKRFVRKDGTVIWISVLSSSVRDRDGNFMYCLRVIQDITERKRDEEAGNN